VIADAGVGQNRGIAAVIERSARPSRRAGLNRSRNMTMNAFAASPNSFVRLFTFPTGPYWFGAASR
jgi:hypothetical protein